MSGPNATYTITGGQPIEGTITLLGAKNLANKAMVATLLAQGESTLSGCSDMGDIRVTQHMLESIGAKVVRSGEDLRIDAQDLTDSTLQLPDSGANRMPILALSALLHRFGEAYVPAMGGCNLGRRPVNFHLEAMKRFGAKVEEDSHGYRATVPDGRLQGCHYTLPYPSVGATENCLLLAVLAEGTTIVDNVAIEPEISALITMLNGMGAQIELTAHRSLRITGVEKLHPTYFKIMGDRIEAASWACLAAATNGRIEVKGINPATLVNFFAPFHQVGGGVKITGPDSLLFYRGQTLTSAVIETDVYPGFSTDWQQPFAILLSQAEGISVIHETVYEQRLGYLQVLQELGLRAQLTRHCLGPMDCRFHGKDFFHSALISGISQLKSDDCVLHIPDLRAGLAYVLAAALAKGTTTLHGIDKLERGYGDLPQRLKDTNLHIHKATA